jgi:hypothetical protein
MMNDNLANDWNNSDAFNIEINNNIIKVSPLIEDVNVLDLYILLYSYILNHHIIITNITMVGEGGLKIYMNVSYISTFTYLEFKMWWYHIEMREISFIDSKIEAWSDAKYISFEIKMLKNLTYNKYPLYPWSEKILKLHIF